MPPDTNQPTNQPTLTNVTNSTNTFAECYAYFDDTNLYAVSAINNPEML